MVDEIFTAVVCPFVVRVLDSIVSSMFLGFVLFAVACCRLCCTCVSPTAVGCRRVGDIGPKIGFNTMDNGFCSFDRVRIPRYNMAMRHQQVDRDGSYRSTGSKEGSKIAYITVMQASGERSCSGPFCYSTVRAGVLYDTGVSFVDPGILRCWDETLFYKK